MSSGIKAYHKLSNNMDSIVIEFAPLVKRIAHHLMGRLPQSVQIDDLIQAGMIGLIESSKNYDTSRGASFSTYAGIRIRGSMLDEIRKGDWAPRSVHRNSRRVAQAIHELENEQGCDAKDVDIAKRLGVDLEEYHKMLHDTNSVKIFGFDDLGIGDDVISTGILGSTVGPLDGLQRDDFRKNLAKGISELPERESLVLALYYDEELNLREVGEILGVSESRISQIHSQAMLRLQARLRDWYS